MFKNEEASTTQEELAGGSIANHWLPVIYLLDVSVLLAMAYPKHIHHLRAMDWLCDSNRRRPFDTLATCSITELGFVRIAGNNNVDMAKTVATAREDLARLKEAWITIFLADSLNADHLPPWVTRSKHVTDGHLVSLAKAWGGRLVTLDGGIPEAILILEQPGGPMMIREPAIPYLVEPCMRRA
jgi:predicted nucleic acid-binding protein